MRIPVLAGGVLLVAVAGCTSNPSPGPASVATSWSASTNASSSASTTSSGTFLNASPSTPKTAESTQAQQTGVNGGTREGTVVRFATDDAFVDVTMGPETPTTRDFLSLLPFTTTLKESADREKIGDPPRQLDVEGTPGSDPEDGDLIYFIPWGNLGFYYDTSGVGYSESTPHLGTYDATEDDLSALEGQTVTVEVVS